MLAQLKKGVSFLAGFTVLCGVGGYGIWSLSLPSLDGQVETTHVTKSTQLSRDALGQAVITARSRQDAAYALGYAHGQDRFFQMDLLRRNAAGELSELFGKAALKLDKRMRFHQLRARAQAILTNLPESDQALLHAYTQGVNEAQTQLTLSGFEYALTGAEIIPWRSEDSLLVIFSMYLDLQAGNFQRDKALIHLESQFSKQMTDFILQPSQYQAALDGSRLTEGLIPIPELNDDNKTARVSKIGEYLLYGSNNWAVTGAHTNSGKGMLSDDMHLGLNVPSIWYRAQLNYLHQGKQVQVTGVSLPGAPAIVVGTNNDIAWGFTNGYLDTADWIALGPDTKTWQVTERIALPKGEFESYSLTLSDYGPVSEFNGKRYALSWVAHQSYAVNLELVNFERVTSVPDALALAPHVGIPIQNLMVVDAQGNAAWQPMGALPARTNPVNTAQPHTEYSKLWQFNELQRPQVFNPQAGKLWTANSRVVSDVAHQRFGDGGYALGARAQQIKDRLVEQSQFDEQDFNRLQLDNEARFLLPWQQHLSNLLATQGETYSEDLIWLENWQQCACAESVGYTLVRFYRDSLIDLAFAPVEQKMKATDSSLKALKRYLEPALWQLLIEQPDTWLQQYPSWPDLQLAAYEQAKLNLTQIYGSEMEKWQWGEVNALAIQHPFSKQIPQLSWLLDMPTVSGFGDSYMPAVQKSSFGASQRFIVQPGKLENAIMTVAGGQSGHPLSRFYRAGFDQYAQGKHTALLPGEIEHTLVINPANK